MHVDKLTKREQSMGFTLTASAFFLPLLLCFNQIDPRWLQFLWRPFDTDTCDANRQIMLYLSAGTVSFLGPWYMTQSQQRLYSHLHGPGHLTPCPPEPHFRIPASYFLFTPLSICDLQGQDFPGLQSPFLLGMSALLYKETTELGWGGRGGLSLLYLIVSFYHYAFLECS